jgi:hypothetical protein
MAAFLAMLVALTTLASCVSSAVRDVTTDEYVTMIRGATEELLDKERRDRGIDGGAEKIWVAVLPPMYLGSVSADNNDAETYGAISEAITDSKLFAPIARAAIRPAIDAARVGKAENIYVKSVREEFLKVLLDSAIVPDYFIVAEIVTNEEQKRGKVVQRKTVIRLQLAHAHDGSLANESSKSTTQGLE